MIRPTAARAAAAIMAKAPVAGEVKTRLCPPLSPEEAADLSRAFLLDTVDGVLALREAAPFLAYSPEGARGLFEALAPGFTLFPQRGEDLGARLAGALDRLLITEGFPAALVLGGDAPTLPAPFLARALDLVTDPDVDVVLGPSEDGGYYLIGLRAPCPALFEGIAWSTAGVLAETLRRAGAAGLRAACLPTWFDVDTPGDLDRLEASFAAGGVAAARHTRRALAARAR